MSKYIPDTFVYSLIIFVDTDGGALMLWNTCVTVIFVPRMCVCACVHYRLLVF